jgi:hypothetical protein
MKSKRYNKHSRQMYEYNILLGRKQIQEEFNIHTASLESSVDKDKVFKSFKTVVKRIKTTHNIKNTSKCERVFVQNYNKLNNKLK